MKNIDKDANFANFRLSQMAVVHCNFFSKNHYFHEMFVRVTFGNFHINIDNKNLKYLCNN